MARRQKSPSPTFRERIGRAFGTLLFALVAGGVIILCFVAFGSAWNHVTGCPEGEAKVDGLFSSTCLDGEPAKEKNQ